MLTARRGLWSAEQYREAVAATAAALEHRTGRQWRPLEDTARSVQILRLIGPQWQSWRRSLDYYPEGELIWLEVDAIIRQQSRGRRSLDDFCRRFHGGESGAPAVVPYSLDDVIVGSPAYQAGVGSGMKLMAVNGRKWTPAVLHAALKAATSDGQSVELLVENAQFFQTRSVPYHDGDRNPHLERVSAQPDLLDEILKPLSH